MMTVNSHKRNSYACCTILVAGVLSTFFGVSCNTKATSPVLSAETAETPLANALDVNKAPPEALEKLPGVGPQLARRIVEFRAENGPFERPEDLILVPGMSDERFRAMRLLVRTN